MPTKPSFLSLIFGESCGKPVENSLQTEIIVLFISQFVKKLDFLRILSG